MPSLPWARGSPRSLCWRGTSWSAAPATSLFLRPFFQQHGPSSLLCWDTQVYSTTGISNNKWIIINYSQLKLELLIVQICKRNCNCSFWIIAFKSFHTSRLLLQQAKSSKSRTTPKAFWMFVFFSEKQNTSIMDIMEQSKIYKTRLWHKRTYL